MGGGGKRDAHEDGNGGREVKGWSERLWEMRSWGEEGLREESNEETRESQAEGRGQGTDRGKYGERGIGGERGEEGEKTQESGGGEGREGQSKRSG